MTSETRKELLDRGYRYDGDGYCMGCGEAVEYWFAPSGLLTPISIIESRDGFGGKTERSASHFSVCRFRKKLRTKA